MGLFFLYISHRFDGFNGFYLHMSKKSSNFARDFGGREVMGYGLRVTGLKIED